MTGWAVTIDVSTGRRRSTEDAVDAFVDLLAPRGGSVSYGSGRYGATFSMGTDYGDNLPDYRVVADKAVRIFIEAADRADMPAWDAIERVEILTFAEQDRELNRSTFPELVGVSEAAELLGVQRQRMTELQTRQGFPRPVARLKAGPVWTRPSLNLFLENWERKPGRPKKAPTSSLGP